MSVLLVFGMRHKWDAASTTSTSSWFTVCFADGSARMPVAAFRSHCGGWKPERAISTLEKMRNRAALVRHGRAILAARDEMGCLSVAESMSAVREGRPVPTVAATGAVSLTIDDGLWHDVRS